MKIKLIVLDIDGVLPDGKVIIDRCFFIYDRSDGCNRWWQNLLVKWWLKNGFSMKELRNMKALELTDINEQEG